MVPYHQTEQDQKEMGETEWLPVQVVWPVACNYCYWYVMNFIDHHL
jgi:hypothetical protein